MSFLIGLFKPLGEWVLTFLFGKITILIKDWVQDLFAKKEADATQKEDITKLNKDIAEGAADEVLSKDFENVLNNRKSDPPK